MSAQRRAYTKEYLDSFIANEQVTLDVAGTLLQYTINKALLRRRSKWSDERFQESDANPRVTQITIHGGRSAATMRSYLCWLYRDIVTMTPEYATPAWDHLRDMVDLYKFAVDYNTPGLRDAVVKEFNRLARVGDPDVWLFEDLGRALRLLLDGDPLRSLLSVWLHWSAVDWTAEELARLMLHGTEDLVRQVVGFWS